VGSVRQLADASAQVVLTRGYTPYGEPLWAQGTASSRYAFTGEDYDSYIKLLFLRARYYSPETGGFLSKDVWQGDYTRPQSLDGWAYVEGNPINFNDPTGWCRYGDTACEAVAQYIENTFQVVIDRGSVNRDDSCDDYFTRQPGTSISWITEELLVVQDALGLTKAFLDRTAHPFSGSIGGKGYIIKRVHTTVTGPMMATGGYPVNTQVPDGLFAGSHTPADQQASLVHESFHAFDLQSWQWHGGISGHWGIVSEDPAFSQDLTDPWALRTPDRGSNFCGSTPYACVNQFEHFADNAAVYALDWLQQHGNTQANAALNAFPNVPAGEHVHRVSEWRDLDASGHSKRRLFFNWYFFGGEGNGLGGQ
jgi:RHS repeat-associated protein